MPDSLSISAARGSSWRERPPQRDLVTEQGRERIGLGVAADISHQGKVEDLPDILRIHAERTGEIDAEHAGAQREIDGLSHRKLGRARQCDHDLCLANAGWRFHAVACRWSNQLPSPISVGARGPALRPGHEGKSEMAAGASQFGCRCKDLGDAF